MQATTCIGGIVLLWTLQAFQAIAQSNSTLGRDRVVAEQSCARCHAISRADERPHAIVIPFRDLHTRYPIEMLVEAQATGVISGHDEMPMFELPREDLNALLAYIDSFSPAGLRYKRAKRVPARVGVHQLRPR